MLCGVFQTKLYVDDGGGNNNNNNNNSDNNTSNTYGCVLL
jgi:hypothetical protein